MPQFPAKLSNGVLEMSDAVKAQLKGWAKAQSDKMVVVEIKAHRTKRSLNQNGNYWANLSECGEFLGYDRDELHYWLQDRFLVDRSTPIPHVVSTKSMTTSEFDDYVKHKVIPLLAEYGYQWTYLED